MRPRQAIITPLEAIRSGRLRKASGRTKLENTGNKREPRWSRDLRATKISMKLCRGTKTEPREIGTSSKQIGVRLMKHGFKSKELPQLSPDRVTGKFRAPTSRTWLQLLKKFGTSMTQTVTATSPGMSSNSIQRRLLAKKEI